jgi:lycopene beta-cyclase
LVHPFETTPESLMTQLESSRVDADYVLVGGGLQNALILLALALRQPQASILLLERGERVGGNHIWSFQARDLSGAALDWAAPLIEYEWPGYQLFFNGSSRWVKGAYRSLSSEHLDRVVRDVASASSRVRMRFGVEVRFVGANEVQLSNGERLRGRVVIDARGPSEGQESPGGGYQKFVGLECRLSRPAPTAVPILMDSRCRQRDGFRFFYVLPFSEDRALIEDTYFSNSAALDVESVSAGIREEAPKMGLEIASVLRTEVGVLPMPALSTFRAPRHGPIHAGYAGGWFNPSTGYSLAAASRLAEHLSRIPVDAVFGREWRRLTRHVRVQSIFLAALNLLMFRWFHDDKRRRLMERFYLLPDAVIHRFFAMETGLVDWWRIMYVGAPWTPKGWGRRARSPEDA